MKMAAISANVLVVMLSLGISPVQAQEEWRQFRGPGGQGVSATKGLPTKWSATDNIRWKTALPGSGTSGPIVVGKHIYLTAHTGYGVDRNSAGDMNDLKRHLLCLNLADGKILWTRDIDSKLPEEPYVNRIHWHSYASSTPASDGSTIVTFFGKTGVIAFDMAGKKLWQADVGSKVHGWGSGASPVIHKNLVFINASVESESLVALDLKTGEEKWRATGIRESWNTPILVDVPGGQTELILADQGRVLGYDPATGKELWRCKGIEYYIVPSLVAFDGTVFCTGGRNYVSLAVKAGGRGEVSGSHVLWRGNKGSNVTSAVYHQGHIYWAHENQPTVYCADAKTGETKYADRVPGRLENFYASATLADGNIYYLDRAGNTVIVAATPELEIIGTNSLGREAGVTNTNIVVAGKNLLIRSEKFLFCIGE